MKKKPPPGATLIARLKERRLQREQTDAENEQPQPGLDVDAQTHEGEETTGSAVTINLDDAVGRQGLIHKNISIDDLRPSTNDYYALTEEIRLAGRFAAVGLIAQGLRLAVIHSADIHREHYGSFEEYCRKEHQMSATYAYRLIRMAEMGDLMAQRAIDKDMEKDKDAPPVDPFDQLLHLGHRHLMALLPLTPDEAEDYLVRGIPVEDKEERVPIGQATEKQIKQALKKGDSQPGDMNTKRWLPRDLLRLAKNLEEAAAWLDGTPDELAEMKSGRGPEFIVLARRFRLASERIHNCLAQTTEEEP